MSKPLMSRLPLALFLLGSAMAFAPSFAATTMSKADMLARYQSERAQCNNGASLQSRHDCLYEAESAYSDARRGLLDVGGAPYVHNQQERCNVHTGDARTACLARMEGEGSVSGSAATGGIYRELTMRRVGDGAATVVEPGR